MKTLFAIFFLACGMLLSAQDYPPMREADKVRIQEAHRLADLFADEIWEGMSQQPFTVLLTHNDHEYLLYHPTPDTSFHSLGIDKLLQTEVFARKRIFSPNLLATFPAVNGHNCIVVGTPEHTGTNSTEWIIVLLHEYFHIHQYTQPDYQKWVAALDLAKGDQSGMWMLNYSFPYDDEKVQQLTASYQKALIEPALSKEDFLKARKSLQEGLSEDDYAYFSFQTWQEGIARYTEYAYLKRIVDTKTEASETVRALPDAESYASYYERFLLREQNLLRELRLEKAKRVAFYSFGLGEGWLLDKYQPEWRATYFQHPFQLEELFK